MKFEDIDVKLENGTLTLRGERKFEKKRPKKAAGTALSGVTGPSNALHPAGDHRSGAREGRL